jgi:uncharacterized membrane protein YjfL (UPF0719 family)
MTEPAPEPAAADAAGATATPARLLRAATACAVLAVVVPVAQAAFAAAHRPDAPWWRFNRHELPWAGAHVLAAVLALGAGLLLLNRLYPLRALLARAREGNAAAAVQCGAHALGAAMVATACFGGASPQSLLVSAAFWGVGIVALAAITAGHRLVTRYRDHDEIADGNLAAALASAGLHLAVALVVMRAVTGDFSNWSHSLAACGLALAWALLLWPLRQIVLARLVLGLTPRALDAAVAAQRDPWLGAAEGLFYIAVAIVVPPG